MKSTLKMRIVAGALVFLGTLVNAEPARSKPAFAICVQNYASVPAHVLQEAEETAHHIFEAAGVATVWMNQDPTFGNTGFHPANKPSCTTAMPSILLNVIAKRILGSDRPAENVLGIAPGEPDQINRNVVYVFNDVAEDIAARQKIAGRSLILGHAMAHEIGHLLAQMQLHSRFGLMRALWSDPEFALMAQGDLLFDREQSRHIRDEVVRRTHELNPTLLAMNSH